MRLLSKSQQEIINLINNGVVDVVKIAAHLRKPEGIIRAQLTRIRNAGPEYNNTLAKIVDSNDTSITEKTQTFDEAVAELPHHAEYDNMVEQFSEQFGGVTDVHPMVIFDMTVQYVKLVGGRLIAHQMIEQVYTALQAMVNNGGNPVQTTSNISTQEVDDIKRQIADLERRLNGTKTV